MSEVKWESGHYDAVHSEYKMRRPALWWKTQKQLPTYHFPPEKQFSVSFSREEGRNATTTINVLLAPATARLFNQTNDYTLDFMIYRMMMVFDWVISSYRRNAVHARFLATLICLELEMNGIREPLKWKEQPKWCNIRGCSYA